MPLSHRNKNSFLTNPVIQNIAITASVELPITIPKRATAFRIQTLEAMKVSYSYESGGDTQTIWPGAVLQEFDVKLEEDLIIYLVGTKSGTVEFLHWT